MPREQVPDLYRDFIGFEKRHGSVQGIEEVGVFPVVSSTIAWCRLACSHLRRASGALCARRRLAQGSLRSESLPTQHRSPPVQVIVNNRRLQYEERASASPLDYDNWFDYLRLEESAGDLDRTREVSASPPVLPGAARRRYARSSSWI